MLKPDMTTVELILVLTCLVSTVVSVLIWRQYHLRYKGTGYWIADFAAQMVTAALVLLTTIIPDWASIILAKSISATGILLGLQGLITFTGVKKKQTLNYFLLAAYILTETWLTYKNPDVIYRDLCTTIVSFIFFVQCVWLLFAGVPKRMRTLTRGTGVIFAGFALIDFLGLISLISAHGKPFDTTVSEYSGAFVMIIIQILVISLTYALVLMYSRRLHEDIEAEEQKFSTAFHTAPFCFALTRLSDGLIVEVNDGFVPIFGFPKINIRGKNTRELKIWVVENDREEFINELIEKKSVLNREYLFRKQGGSTFVGSLTARLMSINSEICILSSIIDITEKKRAEDILIASEEKFRDLFENSPLGNTVSTIEGTIEVNNSFCKMTGYSKEELTDESWSNITHPDDIEKTNEIVNLLLSGEMDRLRTEKRYIRKNGTILYAEVSAYLHRNVNGEPQYIISTINDISERITIENAMKKMNEELELRVEERTRLLDSSHQKLVAANKELEAFTYSVSHDLRAPLRAIDGYTNILSQEYTGRFGQDGDRLIDSILRNTRKMGTLIDDLLALSRVGRSKMKIVSADMQKIAAAVYQELTENRNSDIIDFELDNLQGAMCDPGLIRQVWTNLISNAIKFSAGAHDIKISVRSELDGNFIIYSVTDNGVGFDMKYSYKLFGVFERLHRADEFDGTGVGLAIVKRIITKHGGEVWADSIPGTKTKFSFSLPRVPSFQI
jgi:PAS domain S-box-containing protein